MARMARAAVNLPSEQITDTSLKLPVSAANFCIGVTSALAVLAAKGKAKISIYSLPEFQEWKHKTENFAT